MEKILGKKKDDLFNWWIETSGDSAATVFRFLLIFFIVAVAYGFSLFKLLSHIYEVNPTHMRAEEVYLPPNALIVASFNNSALPVVELNLEQFKAKAGENSLHYIVVNSKSSNLNADRMPVEYFAKNETSTHVLHAYAPPLSYFVGSTWGTKQPSIWAIKNGKLEVERKFDLYNLYHFVFILTGVLLVISVFILTALWNKKIDKMRVALMSAKK